ncbi:beta-ketoacyl synthase N-terminal-like domain-containing protein [Streptomyces sp. DG2A-72]|uniref:type I polyketide synthase n=1 Tax=Streptomyces sp. DG2A-72 TaxID=3051386 RepID=UPI00265BC4DA|nr:type I polyketide synthase [Streptomyces sp. DG2A-72]MDO0938934.1 beta-ketoacyl synthase N-terminal-like domain-containing protein [Streptomyces sp. DG2A-72]
MSTEPAVPAELDHGPTTDRGPMAEPIAVIGLSCRFPDATDPEGLWQLLEERRESVAPAPVDRPWMHELYDPEPRAPGRLPTTRGGFLSGIDLFDAGFFDISPREAARMDPALRILLETAHETIEDAGIPSERLSARPAGVFIGSCHSDYWLRHIADPDALDFYTELGATSRAAHSGRLAYAFDLRGPAMSVDVACSSSLLAVHLAVQSLRAGECDTALAGGVNIILTPYTHLAFSWAGGLSPDGSCKFADASANGFVRSEGAGMVLLKPLRAALAEGDRVRAVIRGSAANNNGFSGMGIAAPMLEGQIDAVRRAFRDAGADPARVAFVEAHGTGTPPGDRTELQALAQALGRERAARFAVASGKANLGHTEAAAGIAGLIKAVLTLERRRVPGNPHLTDPNPAVDWEAAPFFVPKENIDLPAEGELLAGVTGLGASGTNVHVVLSSAPQPELPLAHSPGPYLLTLSARSAEGVQELAATHRVRLLGSNSPPLAELCAASARQRTHHEWRLAVAGQSVEEVAAALAGRAGVLAERPRIVFVFPGQGAQWPGMGRELLQSSTVFRATLERCAEIIGDETDGWSLLEALRGEETQWLKRTAYVQPALWAMSAALADHWRAWGIEPDMVLGQSQGEIAAAYCAGALTLEQSGRLSCLRARLIDELAPPGAMAWLPLPPADVPGLLAEWSVDAQVAVAESVSSAVVSGSQGEIDRLVDACEEREVDCRPIPVAYAAHSAQIDPVREPLLAGLADLVPGETQVPFVSTVTGEVVVGTALDRDYWWRNLRETVLLEPAVRTHCGGGPVVFLQVSPHPVLTSALHSSTGDNQAAVVASLRRGEPEQRALLDALGELYEAGAEPDWEAVFPTGGRSLRLPSYPWQRSRHWYQAQNYPYPPVDSVNGTRPGPAPEEAQMPPADAQGDPVADQVRDLAQDLVRDRLLLDHRVGGTSVMPGAGYLELLLAASGGEVVDARFCELLLLDVADPPELRVRADESDRGRTFTVESRAGGEWTAHATAVAPREPAPPGRGESPLTVRRRCTALLSGEEFYCAYSGGRNTWDGAFRSVEELWHGPGEALARIAARPESEGRLHPALLDSCLQPIAALMPRDERGFVLTGVDRLRVDDQAEFEGQLWAHARIVEEGGPSMLCADIIVSDSEGRTLVELTGVRAHVLDPALREESPEADAPSEDHHTHDDWAHALHWEPARLPAPRTAPGTYLLLGTGGPLGRRLARALGSAGHAVTAAPYGTGDLPGLLAEAAEDGPLEAVICLYDTIDGSSPAGPADDTDSEASGKASWSAKDLQAEIVRLCAQVTDTVRALLDSPCRLLLVTRGAQHALDTDRCPAPWAAALWGLGLVAGQEHPELGLLLADLDDGGDPREDAGELARLVLSGTEESQVALRGGKFLSPRIGPATPGDDRPPLALHTDGGLDGLSLIPFSRTAPGPGEIEIEITHAGLNYHDVLAAAGADGDAEGGPPSLGCECAGTVARIGSNVTGFTVADRVTAFSYPALRTHLTVPASLAVPTPDALSQAEAAALPAAHATAYYALVDRARLQPGEHVLIHSATGGVGLAAIDIARMIGATVYATAGSPAKRELLLHKSVEKVADSRGTDFAREFEDGVDVVLGTLVGDGVDAGFSILRPFGRYVDLSINDIAAGRPLPMSVFADSRSYLPVNLLHLYRHAPDRLRDLVATVTDLVAEGALAPPAVRVFPVEDASAAFTLMARSGHTGKIVLALPREENPEPVSIRDDATYLVTGGLSGVGGLLAQWLAGQGAGRLLLTGRSVLKDLPSDDRRVALLKQLRTAHPGTEIAYEVLDAGDEEALTGLLDRADIDGQPPIAGVAHAAAVLTPGHVADLTPEELARILHPKVAGGWALHRAFADRPLDFFVLFSSAVAALGGLTMGHQLGAYAAANTFTDALAVHRTATGLPATVIDWGYWTEVGIAARLSESNGHDVRPRGMGPIRPEDAPPLFDLMLRTTGRHLLFPPPDWHRYLAAYPQDARNPLLHGVSPGTGSDRPDRLPTQPAAPAAESGPARKKGDSGTRTSKRPKSRGQGPTVEREQAGDGGRVQKQAPMNRTRTPGEPVPDQAVSAKTETAHQDPAPATRDVTDAATIEEQLVAHLALILGSEVARIDRSRAMNRLGMDSLMAVELRTRMRRDHGLDVPVARLLGSDSIRTVAAALAADPSRQESA